MLKKFALMLALPLALVMSTLAVAQSNPPTPPPFAALGGQTAISASNASSRVALPASTSAFGAITVYNASTTVDAYVALGDVTVVALNSGGVCAAPTFTMCLVKAGTSIVIWASGNTYIAGITSSSTASLVIYQGSGGVQLSAIYSGTSPPSGPAGGDLSGTYPNPTVVQATAGFALPSSALTFSGNITGAAIFGTNGIKVKTTSGTLSDTTSSGTVAANYNNLFGGNTQTATSATTITNNYGSYFTAPICSTNVTCTNNYALGADSIVAGTNQGFSVSAAGGLTASGITSSNGRLSVVGSRSGVAWGTSGITSIGSGAIYTDSTSSGTVATQYIVALKAPTIAANSPTTFTNSYNTYVENPVAGTNVTQTTAWALGADSLFDAGKLGLASGSIVAWNADTGLSRDSVLGAGNLDLGNGTANDKTGILNAAKVALGGCTIGTDNFCITGPMSVSGQSKFLTGVAIGSATTAASQGVSPSGSTTNVNGGGSGALVHLQDNSGNVYLEATTGLATFGGPAAAAPTAQTIAVQSVLAGTSNTVGQPVSLNGSQSTGTAAGGSVLIKTSPADVTHTVNTFTGSASPYTIGFTAGNITTYPVGTVMTVSGCTTATLNGTYTVTASSSGSVTATTSATGTGSPTTCLIVGNTSQNPEVTAVTIDPSANKTTFAGNVQAALVGPASGGQLRFWGSGTAMQNPSDGVITFLNNAGSSFGRLQLGGTTSSYPSIKLNGTAINFRLADDSADAPITASAITNSGSLIAGGSAPTPTGTCTRGTQNGGNTTGSIVLTCTAQTLILTFATTAPTGYMCEAIDQTTTADTMKQTANSTTTCTLTGTTAASDVVIYQARAY